MNQMLAKKADVDRIYLPCQEGGRSLMNLEKEYKATMIGLQTSMTNRDNVQIQAVLRHQNSKALHSVPKEAEKYLTEAGTTDDMTNDHGKTATWKAKQLKLKYKEDFKKMVRDKVEGNGHAWKVPQLSGQGSYGCRTITQMDKAHWTHHNSTGPGTEHQILHQTHHQARNHRQMQNVPYTARNCGTPHIRVPKSSSRSVS